MDQMDNFNSQGIENFAEMVQQQEQKPIQELSDDAIQYLLNQMEEEEKKKGSPATYMELRQAFVKNPGPHAALVPQNRGIH